MHHSSLSTCLILLIKVQRSIFLNSDLPLAFDLWDKKMNFQIRFSLCNYSTTDYVAEFFVQLLLSLPVLLRICKPLTEISVFSIFGHRTWKKHNAIRPFYVSFHCCPTCLGASCSPSTAAVSPAVLLHPWQVNDDAWWDKIASLHELFK